MENKIGRNDPCTCGSGKKYKVCCMAKDAAKSKYVGGKRKITAKWVNAPQGPNLIERTFGNAITASQKEFKLPTQSSDELPTDEANKE